MPGLQILNAGVGTGKDQMAIIKALGSADGVIGLDISPVMLKLVRRRTGSVVISGDVLRLPFRDQSFDRILCAYVLDLIPTADLPIVLGEFKRALKPAGRMVLVSLTDGISPLSRLLISGWIKLYKLDPLLLGGCRPLRLVPWLQRAGFEIETNTVLMQLAVPSEVVAATLK
jgi:ubiquinone/menaquinone biosynthesis C-methylase UbiE